MDDRQQRNVADEDLLARMAARDPQALADLYDSYSRLVFSFVLHIVNDPAAGNNSGVRRVYQRDEFRRSWFKSGSGGVAYLVRPESWLVPDRTYARGSW